MQRFQGTPDDVHEWLSIEDADEQRTWMIDLTFLRSPWRCIFGAGCKGILDHDATALGQGCCSHGAHFIDDDDVATVVGSSARLRKRQWEQHRAGAAKGVLGTEDGATTTRVVNGACIFLNSPTFSGGAGCALHIAAIEAGERPLDWKPDVCWQVPLRLEHATDDHGHVTSTLREWKRRDWSEGGAEFHWWCTDAPEAFVGAEPVYRYLRDEIVELVGLPVYRRIVRYLEAQPPTAVKRTAMTVPLPHPAVRR